MQVVRMAVLLLAALSSRSEWTMRISSPPEGSKITQENDDTIVIVTAVSLASKIRPPHEGPFDLVPPKDINLRATFPLFGN